MNQQQRNKGNLTPDRGREGNPPAPKRTPTRPSNGNDRYRSLFENIPIGLYITTPDGRILDANPSLIRMLGYPDKASLLGTKASALYVNPKDREEEQSLFGHEQIVKNYETRLKRRDGTTIWVRDTCRVVLDKDGEVLCYEGSLQDITEEKRYQEKLVYLARHDPLTDLYNRHTLAEILEREITRAQRYHHPIGILMIDVNRFKEINDRFGHTMGDQVLQSVAGILRCCVRESDIVVRYGGDEFLVLLLETNGETEIVRKRILKEMSRQKQMGPLSQFPTSLAIGTAHWVPGRGDSIENILAEADRAMYEAKRQGAAEG